ncbi:unnamed protein product [Polarella glacialis]|uniref:Uncharacterized protein n=1 Tax=Polarella glacialis TaxID=89957 RepID=A0A813EJX7_POLGL|nr:unnamed protein product [Polarella glacialis]
MSSPAARTSGSSHASTAALALQLPRSVSIAPEKWTQAVYSTPESSQAKAEVEKLSAMKFDPSFFSSSYTQCIGRGQSHKECVASLQNDTRITAPGPLAGEAANQEITAAISCMDQHRDPTKCTRHFEALRRSRRAAQRRPRTSATRPATICLPCRSCIMA